MQWHRNPLQDRLDQYRGTICMFKGCIRLLLLAFCGVAAAQTINPNQIRPAGTNTYVLTTVAGHTVWAPGGGGAGCTLGGFSATDILSTNGTACVAHDY